MTNNTNKVAIKVVNSLPILFLNNKKKCLYKNQCGKKEGMLEHQLGVYYNRLGDR